MIERKYIDRFWQRVDKQLGEGCWLWTGSLATNGYGRFWIQGRHEQAHRIAWLLAGTEIPADLCVLHRCDTRPCVRREHLFLGTYRDNARDMALKGRAHLQRNPMGLGGDKHWTRRHPDRFAGDRNPAAKLTVVQVVELRERFALGETYQSLSKAFEISTGSVGFIVKGQHWRDPDGPIATERRAPGPRRKV